MGDLTFEEAYRRCKRVSNMTDISLRLPIHGIPCPHLWSLWLGRIGCDRSEGRNKSIGSFFFEYVYSF